MSRNLLLFLIMGFNLNIAVKERRCFDVGKYSSGHLEAATIPNYTVYDFAYRIWQGVNYWPTNGADDYKNNISQFRPYISQSFRSELDNQYRDLIALGELQDRSRTMVNTNAASIDYDKDVIKLSADRWQVNITTDINEYIGTHEVKHVRVKYPLVVTKNDISIDENPWGLQIVGFAKEPTKIALG